MRLTKITKKIFGSLRLMKRFFLSKIKLIIDERKAKMMTRKTKVPNPQIPNPHPNCLVQEVYQDQYHQRFEPKIKLCKKS